MLKRRKKSAWRYLSSSTYGGSVKAIVEVGVSIGSISFLSPGGDTYEFDYRSGGIGAGLGISVSYPESDSIDKGWLWILESFRGEELTAGDLAGACLVAEVSGGVSDFSGSGVAMVLGIPPEKLQEQMGVGLLQLGANIAAGQFVGDKMQRIMSQTGWLESHAKAVLYILGTFEGSIVGLGAQGSLGYLRQKSVKKFPRIDGDIKFHEPLSFKSSSTARDTLAFIEISGDVLFDFDKYVIKPSAVQVLHKAGAALRPHQGRPVSIFGYTDSIGSNHYNDGLSEKRARAVMQWLVSNRYINPAKVTIQGHGEKFPVAPNTTPAGRDNPEGRARNRRVEIIVFRS